MQTGTQETKTETKTLSISDENISQADFERLRSGEKVEVKESAPSEKLASETTDDSDTSESEEIEDSTEIDEGSDADESIDVEKAKKKSGTQRRIEKLVKERTAERQARELAERELFNLREQMNSKSKPEVKTQATEGDDPEPIDTDYETYNDYVKDLAKWNVRQQRKAEKADEEKRSLETKANEKVKTHNQKMDAYKKEHSSFNDDLNNFMADYPDFDLANSLKFSIADSEVGPQLLHELIKNPQEFLRINSLGEYDIARAIGRLEAKLSVSSEESKKPEIKTKTTKAPPPAKPLSASAANGKKSISDDDISQAEYERIRNEQEKRKRGF